MLSTQTSLWTRPAVKIDFYLVHSAPGWVPDRNKTTSQSNFNRRKQIFVRWKFRFVWSAFALPGSALPESKEGVRHDKNETPPGWVARRRR
jgi:hypothetical protein